MVGCFCFSDYVWDLLLVSGDDFVFWDCVIDECVDLSVCFMFRDFERVVLANRWVEKWCKSLGGGVGGASGASEAVFPHCRDTPSFQTCACSLCSGWLDPSVDNFVRYGAKRRHLMDAWISSLMFATRCFGG